MTTILDILASVGAWSLPHLWLPLAAWTLAAGLLYVLLDRWRSAHPLVQQRTRQALLLALPLGLLAAAALTVLPEAPTGGALPTLLVLPALPVAASAPVEAAPSLHVGLMHAIGLITLAAALLALARIGGLARHAFALWRFRRALPDGIRADSPVQRCADRLFRQVGIRRPVRVVRTERPIVPMTFGFVRPVIVLPEALTEDNERLCMALMHELVHIRRHDYIAHGVEQLVAALFVVHPLAGWLCRSIAAWRERACDAAVLEASQVQPGRYATLLRDLTLTPASGQAATLALTEDPHRLKPRLEAMKDYTNLSRRFRSPKRAAVLLGALLLVIATGIVACTELVDANEPPTATPSTSQATAENTIFMSVAKMPEIVGGIQSLANLLEYPPSARNAGIEGTVYVQFTVDEQGNAVDPAIKKSPHQLLSEAALDAVEQLTFEPGKQRGKAVKVRMTLPIRFQLPNEETASYIISLRLHEDGTLYLNDQSVTLDALPSRLSTLISDPEETVVNFRVAQDAPMGRIKEVQQRLRETDDVLKISYSSSPTAPGLLYGQVETGPLGVEGRHMAFRDLQFEDHTVTGHIVDAATGEPLPGANIVIPGTSTGAATAADGSFIIRANAPIERIKASYMGFQTVTAQR